MIKNAFVLVFVTLVFLTGCEKDTKLPDGYEIVTTDGRSHFVYIAEENLGNKVSQRETARKICKVIFEQEDYCEVYYYNNKANIPQQFPIMNRLNPIGTYKLRDGKETFRFLK